MTPINQIDWTVRARNILRDSGITTLEQLCAMDFQTVAGMRGGGAGTQREFLHHCLLHLRRPKWMADLHKMRCSATTIMPEGFAYLAGPYASSERDLMQIALATLWPIDSVVVVGLDGYHIYRAATGMKAVEDEP